MPMIEISNLTKKFEHREVLSGINLTINKGETKVIMGSSGSGKTTLIRCINRLIEPTSGKIIFNGQDIMCSKINLRQLRQEIGFVFQNFALYRHLNVLDNVALALRFVKKISKTEARDRALYYLQKFRMASHHYKYPSELSGGQKQRVALARSLAMEPQVVILDEPTSALDPLLTRELSILINQLRNESLTIICVTHDISLASEIADKIAFMDVGTIRGEGTLAELRQSTDHQLREFFKSPE